MAKRRTFTATVKAWVAKECTARGQDRAADSPRSVVQRSSGVHLRFTDRRSKQPLPPHSFTTRK